MLQLRVWRDQHLPRTATGWRPPVTATASSSCRRSTRSTVDRSRPMWSARRRMTYSATPDRGGGPDDVPLVNADTIGRSPSPARATSLTWSDMMAWREATPGPRRGTSSSWWWRVIAGYGELTINDTLIGGAMAAGVPNRRNPPDRTDGHRRSGRGHGRHHWSLAL